LRPSDMKRRTFHREQSLAIDGKPVGVHNDGYRVPARWVDAGQPGVLNGERQLAHHIGLAQTWVPAPKGSACGTWC
jgi:hypothetical protein